MSPAHFALKALALAGLSTIAAALPAADTTATPFDISGFGSFRVGITQTSSSTTTIKIYDSVSEGVNGVQVPHSDQSATCKMEKVNKITEDQRQVCGNSKAWSIWWKEAANGQPAKATIHHLVKYKSSVVVDNFTDFLPQSFHDSDLPGYIERKAQDIPVLIDTAPPVKLYKACEYTRYGASLFKPGEVETFGFTFDFVDGRGPLTYGGGQCYDKPDLGAIQDRLIQMWPTATVPKDFVRYNGTASAQTGNTQPENNPLAS